MWQLMRDNLDRVRLSNEEFEYKKGVIRICKSKDRQHNGQKRKDRQHNDQKRKDRQHNGQKKKYKRTNNDLQNIHIKPKIEQHEPH